MNAFKNKILVLDDDTFILNLVQHLLEREGCTSVVTRDNGRAALELVDNPRERPELILLDLNMPGMDGVEFVRHLVGHRYTGSLILMSGEDEHLLLASERLVRAHKIPVLGRLRKPVTAEGLAELLKKFPLSRQGSLRSSKEAHSAEKLRAAIANGELINYYQPKVSLSSGEVVGMESLARWHNPQDGMVYPRKFLGVAESFGLIHDLTDVVLENALAHAKSWADKGLALQLVVNVSVHNLDSLEFADTVDRLTAVSGMAPQNVMLEVAEGWLPMHDLRTPLETLTRLHLKRFRLSIDEFGTGYSSLMQLTGLPVDELKVDRSLVHGLSTNTRVKAKFDANLAIARQLKLQVAAVGVEDIADWDMLRLTGCDFAQGSFIADPMPTEDVPGWIERWQERLCQERLIIGRGCRV